MYQKSTLQIHIDDYSEARAFMIKTKGENKMEKDMKNIEEEGVRATIVLAKLLVRCCKARGKKWEGADTELVSAEETLDELEEKLRRIQLARAVEERKAGMEEIG